MDTLLLDRLFQTSYEKEIPFQGQFELTSQCNFQCKMCYLDKSESRKESYLPASFWTALAGKAREMGMLVLSISGGEPLLYPELTKLMEALIPMGFLISFNTNGALLDDRMVEWFDVHPVAKINISLYGASEETYRKLCRCGEDSYARVLHAIDHLKAHGHNVFITNVLTPENLHEQDQMKQMMEARGQSVHVAEYLLPSCNPGYVRIAPEVAASYGYARICKESPMIPAMIRAYEERPEQFFGQLSTCNAGKCSFAVSHDGRMIPCVMMRHFGYDLLGGSFAEGWNYIRQTMKEAQIPSKCTQCQYAGLTCPACKAALYLEKERCGSTCYLCEIAEKTAQLALGSE